MVTVVAMVIEAPQDDSSVVVTSAETSTEMLHNAEVYPDVIILMAKMAT